MKKAIIHMMLSFPALLLLSGFGSSIFHLSFRIENNSPLLKVGCIFSLFFSVATVLISVLNIKTSLTKAFSIISYILAIVLFAVVVFVLVVVTPTI